MAKDSHTYTLYLSGTAVSWAKATRVDSERWRVTTKHGGTPHATSERLAKRVAREFIVAIRAGMIREGKGKASDFTLMET